VAHSKARILLIDDDPLALRAVARMLRTLGHEVDLLDDPRLALERVRAIDYHLVLSDITMPGMNGLELLDALHRVRPRLPVVLVTASPTMDSALEAFDHGAVRYLVKPVSAEKLVRTVADALDARGEPEDEREPGAARAGIDALWMAYQPIFAPGAAAPSAYEALLRCSLPGLGSPPALIGAAQSAGLLLELGRRIRASVAAALLQHQLPRVFINLHPADLYDPDLYDPAAPLSRFASQVVLEITERSAISEIDELLARCARLRALGYVLAVDDLGAGYSGLASLALLKPEYVKLDMSLVRGIDGDPVRERIVRSVAALCRELGAQVVAEGIETTGERAAVCRLGCDLMQGYLLGRPAPLVAPAASIAAARAAAG
jgi:EAL domain-containing protein (putative c-di-GMP-specific phosphodiesterase class I)